MLRRRFLAADIGITGANFLVAETGSAVIVTNEGNGDLSAQLPKTHIVLASIDKVVPTLDDLATLLRAAGALRDRPGHDRLHEPARPARKPPATRTAPRNATSSSSTTAGPTC